MAERPKNRIACYGQRGLSGRDIYTTSFIFFSIHGRNIPWVVGSIGGGHRDGQCGQSHPIQRPKRPRPDRLWRNHNRHTAKKQHRRTANKKTWIWTDIEAANHIIVLFTVNPLRTHRPREKTMNRLLLLPLLAIDPLFYSLLHITAAKQLLNKVLCTMPCR